jgi:hypothetical protein
MTSTPATTALRPAQNVVSPGVHAMRQPGQWSVREAQLIGSIIAPGLDPDDLRVFAAVCRHTGLDPFRRQIYAWKDKGRLVIHIAINGLRAQAARSGLYEGQVGPEWCGPEGGWRDVWLSENPPAACRVGILRRGFASPIWSTVTWREFNRSQARTNARGPSIWDEKPAHMLAIRAEGHGLQRAFPELFDRVFEEASAVGATIMAADEEEMPQLPQNVDVETGEILDEVHPLPADAGEGPAEIPSGGANPAESPSESSPPASPATPDHEAFYSMLIELAERMGVRPMDIPGYLDCANTPEEIHAAMSERGLTAEKLLGAIRRANGGR